MKKYIFTLVFIFVGHYMLADGATDFTVEKDRLCDEHYYSLVKLKVKRPESAPFSINAQGGKVVFSPGNLQYQASTNTFRFATRQWENVGDGVNTSGVTWDSMGLDGNVYSVNSNNNLVSKKYGGWIDLFGWGTSGFVRSRLDNKDPYVSNIYPYSISKRTINATNNYYGYGPSTGISGVYQHIDLSNPISRNYDWGQYNRIYSKWISYDTTRAAPTGRDSIVYDSTYYHERIWRTLTSAEWDYLFKRRIEHKTQPSWALAKVDNQYEGILLFPDDFELLEAKKVGFSYSDNINYGNNTYATMSLENFQALEKLGVVFLPQYAHYWSATSNGTQYAKSLNGPHQTNVLVDDPRYTRNQVRLVRDITTTEFTYNTSDAVMQVDYPATSKTFDFTAHADWRAESTVPWLTVSKAPLTSVNSKLTGIPFTSSTVYDGAGTHRLKIDVANNEGVARTGSVVITGHNKQFLVIVEQNTGNPAVVKDTVDTIPCGFSEYVWHIDYETHTKDIPITQTSGTERYYDTLRDQHGYDSIISRLILTVATALPDVETKNYTGTIPCGLKSYNYTWKIDYGTVKHERTVTQIGTYYDTLKNRYGCDSIYAKLVLKNQTITPTTKNYTGTIPCGLSSYEWNINYGTVSRKRTLTKTGTYYDTLKSVGGCDSIYAKLVLTKQTVTPKTNPYSATVALNATYSWNMEYKTKSIKASSTAGTYTYRDTLQTKYGCDSIYSVLTLTVENQQISGDFSVSESKKVKFSPGNLQYCAAQDKWRFAERQFDRCGAGGNESTVYWDNNGTQTKCDNRQISSTYGGWIDLFGWGTSGVGSARPPYYLSANPAAYSWSDWGQNVIGSDPANTWRTPTKDEWVYLLETRQVNGGAGYSFVRLKYGNNATDTVTGVVIYPDDFTFAKAGVSAIAVGASAGVTAISADVWSKLEKTGCVFLPGSTYRYFSGGQPHIDEALYGLFAQYWSATAYDASLAYYANFRIGGRSINPANYYYRYCGFAVRLIQDL